MIRAVREFNCAYGPRREIQLAEDSHHPVRLSIEQISDGIGASGTAFTPTLSVEYLGHRKDLIALGCISRHTLASLDYGRLTADPRGGLVRVTSSTDPRRGLLELSYLAQTRLLAAMLPGVQRYGADWLETLTERPRLRLVIDNTRRQRDQRADLPTA